MRVMRVVAPRLNDLISIIEHRHGAKFEDHEFTIIEAATALAENKDGPLSSLMANATINRTGDSTNIAMTDSEQIEHALYDAFPSGQRLAPYSRRHGKR